MHIGKNERIQIVSLKITAMKYTFMFQADVPRNGQQTQDFFVSTLNTLTNDGFKNFKNHHFKVKNEIYNEDIFIKI